MVSHSSKSYMEDNQDQSRSIKEPDPELADVDPVAISPEELADPEPELADPAPCTVEDIGCWMKQAMPVAFGGVTGSRGAGDLTRALDSTDTQIVDS